MRRQPTSVEPNRSLTPHTNKKALETFASRARSVHKDRAVTLEDLCRPRKAVPRGTSPCYRRPALQQTRRPGSMAHLSLLARSIALARTVFDSPHCDASPQCPSAISLHETLPCDARPVENDRRTQNAVLLAQYHPMDYETYLPRGKANIHHIHPLSSDLFVFL